MIAAVVGQALSTLPAAAAVDIKLPFTLTSP